MRLLLGMFLAAVVAAPLVAVGPGDARSVAATDPSSVDVCAGGPIPVDALLGGIHPACSLVGRTVTADGASVIVPRPGLSVGADGYGAGVDGLTVTNRDGLVIASQAPAGSEAAAAAPRKAAGPCRATAYTLENGKHPWGGRMTWRLRTDSVPLRLGARETRTQLTRAVRNWTRNHNTCGISGRPQLRTGYAGSTRASTGIRTSGTRVRCGGYDRTNTVEFGPLPGRLLGWTCYWWGSDNKMLAFDTRITNGSDLVIDPGPECRRDYDLQAVATHEFGHAFGLGHVSDPSLTMHHVAPHCSTAPRTLGRGDVRGLRALYGLTRG